MISRRNKLILLTLLSVSLSLPAGTLVAAPEACDSWKEWTAGVKAAAEGELEEGASGKLTPAAIRGLLQVRVPPPC